MVYHNKSNFFVFTEQVMSPVLVMPTEQIF